MRLRSYLVLLVLITLAPLPIFFGFMVFQHGATYRSGMERELLRATRSVSAALDDYFDATIRSLQDLATSEHLDVGRLREFHAQAARMQGAHEEWIGISLFDLSGQRLLYTREPFGATLPPRPGAMAARFVADAEGELLGYLHIKDVLESDEERRQRPIDDKWVRPFATVGPDDLLHEALESLQLRGAHMARVVRRDGEVLGLVTLEDVLEELVGVIRDGSHHEAGATAVES